MQALEFARGHLVAQCARLLLKLKYQYYVSHTKKARGCYPGNEYFTSWLVLQPICYVIHDKRPYA